MSEGKHHEIERKYLIAVPDAAFLRAQPECAVWEIEQIYLTALPGCTRRVRKVTENGQITCYKTFKRRLNALTAEEDEGVIPREEYDRYVSEESDPAKRPILKTRYRIPYEGQLLEFDIYPFWTDRAVLEIELDSEEQPTYIPDWVKVLKEVTADYRYKNVCLAQSVPMDDL